MPNLAHLPATAETGLAPSALAPMQDVTDLPFMTAIGECGAPDWFFTEYFRVTETSRLEKHILRSITENPTGRPVFAQLIGENIPAMQRAAAELLQYPVGGIDLNMGCPAPKVYRKNVGGGLLRDLPHVDRLLGSLRDTVTTRPFTVKTRIGFADTKDFDALLALLAKHRIDLLSLHGRTVKELYRSEVHYEYIARAAAQLPCPVLANGNITSADRAAAVLAETGCSGVMIGRSAIRNPWIFRQARERLAGRPVPRTRLREVRAYVDRLWQVTHTPDIPEAARVGKMKKYLNFVGQSIDAAGAFLAAMRPTTTAADLFAICDRHLLAEPDAFFADEPFAGVIARPNCETPDTACSLDTITS